MPSVLLQRNPVHYYQRESAQSYLGVDSRRTSLNGTGGYLKVGRKGNAKWFFFPKPSVGHLLVLI